MKPILVFSTCDCVEEGSYAIQGLFQESFDGDYIHFKMVCLFCDKEVKVKEDFESYSVLNEMEGEVLLYLEKECSNHLLIAANEGRTYTIPQHWGEQI